MERFVHSLVRATAKNQAGWCAPVEMGEDAPQGVNFVIPVDNKGRLQNSYVCETIKGLGGAEPITVPRSLVKVGDDSFRLQFGERDVWFTVTPTSKKHRLLPYVGKLEHPDFHFSFIEIEPERQAVLDELYEQTGEFVIGCDPFLHYQGIKCSAEHSEPAT